MSAQTPGQGSGPAAKRRRVDLANSTLRKPFRSPLLSRPAASSPVAPLVVGVGAATGAGGSAASSPSLRTRPRQPPVEIGLELGLGESTLTLKTRVGEGEDHEREIADSDDDGGDDDLQEFGEEDGGDDDLTATSTGTPSFQIPASPSLRTAVGGFGRGIGIGRTWTGKGQEGRRYPPPVNATTTTPRRQVPSKNTNMDTGFKISHTSSYSETPSKKRLSSLPASLLATGVHPPKTPTTTSRNIHAANNHDKNKESVGGEAEGEFDILAHLQTATLQTQSQISETEKQLDIAKQARRIQERGSNRELEILVEKWKQASRQAAEDLFELIRGRVDGMGGGKAWRDSRKRQLGGYFEDEDGGGNRRRKKNGRGSDYGDGSDDDGQEEDDDEEEEEGPEEAEGGDEDDQDTGFTMAMMLESLNIEPDVLGWDAGEEKWRD